MDTPFRPAFLVVAFFLSLTSIYAQPLDYPAASGVVDVTQPPYNADNTGVEDASAAINQALFDFNDSHALLYLPAGTYRLSEPIEWQNPPGCESGTTFTCRRYIGLTGAGVDATILRVDDNHPLFQNINSPTAVVNTGSSAAMAFENTIRHLTVNTGSGNPGATGIRFMASNVGGLHHVKVVSGDGQGFRGIDLGPNEQHGPAFYNDLTVDGFDTGIRTFGNQNGAWFERVTLRNQGVFGFFNRQHPVSIRMLDYEGSARAIFNQGDGGSTFTLIDSRIAGTGSAIDKIGFQNNNRRPVFLRNVEFSGWQLAYQEFSNGFDLGNLPNGFVEEYTSETPTRLCDNRLRSLNLPIRETPDVPYEAVADWTNIADFGAVIDNGFRGEGSDQDDSQALRDALAAAVANGSETVVIPQPRAPFPARYMVYGDFVIPPTVKRVIGTKAKMDGDYRFVVGDGTEPLVIEDFVSVSGIEHTGNRTLILKHSVIRDYHGDPGGAAGDVYIEDVVGGPWEFNQQDVWARQFNLEVDSLNVVINGGSLWALGVKTERKGTIIEANDGARVEIIGAFHYSTISEESVPKPLYVVNESSLSVAGLKELTYINDPYDVKLRETRNGQTNELTRGNEVLRTPLLVAYASAGDPATAPVIDAGEDQLLLLPENSTTLTGSVNDDTQSGGDCFVASTWRLIDPVASVSIADARARTTDITFTEAGRYAFELAVADGNDEVRDTTIVHVFDSYASTEDHDADGSPSGNGADAHTQGWASFQDNYGASGSISAKNYVSFPRKSIVRVDLTGLLPSATGRNDLALDNALLEFEITTTNTGLIENWTYNIFGLNDGHPGEDWIEGTGSADVPATDGVTYETLPANVLDNAFNGGVYDPAVPNSGGFNHEETTFLGTFSTTARQRTKVHLASAALRDFINADADGQVSFLLSRVDNAVNLITFGTKENTNFAAPRLWVDFRNEALPVELIAFTATPAEKHVELQWRGSTDADFSHFAVERSTDGLVWSEIAKVYPTDNFSHIDRDAYFLAAEVVKYRLKMVDVDGGFDYSPIRIVELSDPQSATRISPNPFAESFRVYSPLEEMYDVFDVHGRLVRSFTHRGAGTQVQGADWESGVYVVRGRLSGEMVRVVRR